MRIPVLFIAGMILLSSCYPYQYATISSPDMSLTDDSTFVAENDTLRLAYHFGGFNAPISLSIKNKLSVPVFIDWRQSALILKDKVVSYVPNQVPVTGTVYRPGDTSNKAPNSAVATLGAIATMPVTVDFIPPNALIAKNFPAIVNGDFPIPDSIGMVKKQNSHGATYKVRQVNFNEQNSPLQFRSYLTVMVGEAGAKPSTYDHHFYVSELQNTTLNPTAFGWDSPRKGNLYLTHVTIYYAGY